MMVIPPLTKLSLFCKKRPSWLRFGNDCNFIQNVFVKPNEQNRACSSYAMARKRRMKSNVFVKPNEQNRACSSCAMARK